MVIPEAAGGPQALHAVYGKACLPAMERRLRAGQLKIVGLLDDLRVLRVPAAALRPFADPDVAFMNLNTPEDLARARALWDRQPTGAARATSSLPAPDEDGARGLTDARVAGLELGSLQELNGLPAPLREGLYGRLMPAEICARFGVDPATGLNGAGHRLLRIFAPPEQSWARVELRASRDDRDPLVLVDVEIGPFGVPELSFVQITDPASQRFGIDRDDDGQETLLGTLTRNLSEERRAAAAGLAPGQVRPGLGLLGRVLDAMEDFCRLFGKDLFLVEPLFYHSALLYERHGCDYLLGRELMDSIHREFQPGWPSPPGARRVDAVPAAGVRPDDSGPELGHPRRHTERARRRRPGAA